MLIGQYMYKVKVPITNQDVKEVMKVKVIISLYRNFFNHLIWGGGQGNNSLKDYID